MSIATTLVAPPALTVLFRGVAAPTDSRETELAEP